MLDLVINCNQLFRELLRSYMIDNHAVKAFTIGKRASWRNHLEPNTYDNWEIKYSSGDVREFCKYLTDNGYTYKFTFTKIEPTLSSVHTQVRRLVIEGKE